MSAIIEAALAYRKVVRDEFELYRTAQFEAADRATRGNLLNADAKAAGISAWSLFIGPHARARRWASEELVELWDEHGRLTSTEYEAQVMAGQELAA